jgi:two-component system chemotaxis sensor kinase CheA
MDDLMLEFAAELRDGFAELVPMLADWRSDPNNQAIYNTIFRYLHTVKAGAGFVRMSRIEALAAAAEQGLTDLRHWALGENARHVALIIVVLERIDAIAQAIELGIGYPTLGEDELIADLLGQPRPMAADSMPFDPTQIRSVRLSLSILDGLIEQSEALHRSLLALGDMPLPASLAILRNDMLAHARAIRVLRYAPAAQLYDGLSGYVHQLAAQHGCAANLITEGETVWLDRAHIPILRHALCHLLRNAIAHGIEPVDERARRGKPLEGQIRIGIDHVPGSIAITLSDDGRGIDYAALAAQAEVSTDAIDMIQRAGVTTAHFTDDLAGRGVGLDAVRIALERLDGALELYDRPGQGFVATMIMPELALTAHG